MNYRNPSSDFHCPVCRKQYFSRTGRLHHIKTKHPDFKAERASLIRCKYCLAKKRSLAALEDHIQKEHFSNADKKEFACGLCDASFHSKSRLRQHSSLHAKLGLSEKLAKASKKVKCSHCGDMFLGMEKLIPHLKNSHDVTAESLEQQCNLFPGCSSMAGNLSFIKLRHSPVSSVDIKCKLCCTTDLVNNEKKNFSCHICCREFDTKRKLQNHSRKHEVVELDTEAVIPNGLGSKI